MSALEEVFEAAAGAGADFDNVDGAAVVYGGVGLAERDQRLDGGPVCFFVRGVPAYDERVAPEVVELGVAVCGVGDGAVGGAGDFLVVHCECDRGLR